MGHKYSKEEKAEFLHYKKLIDRAIEEKERWLQYKQIRKTLDNNLKDKRKLIN